MKLGNLEWRKKYVLRKIKEFSKHPLINFESESFFIKFVFLTHSMAYMAFDTTNEKPVGIVFDIPSICSIKKSVLDYLVLHELCHIRFRDHGKDFQNLLAEVSGIWVFEGQTYNHPDFNLEEFCRLTSVVGINMYIRSIFYEASI